MKKPSKKQIIGLGLCLLCVLFGVIMFFSANTKQTYQELDTDEFFQSFEGETSPYIDKHIRLTGIVGDFGNNHFDENMYITFQGKKEFNACEIRFYIKDKQEQKKVMDLKKKDSVTLEGRCDGKHAYDIIIMDAHIVKQ